MISHEREALFVHIPKCGGVSVERLFVEDAGLGWRERAPLLLREPWDEEVAPPRLAHLTASDYVKGCYLSSKQFRNYTKFALIRHPEDRTKSAFVYLGLHRIMTFERYVLSYLPAVIDNRDHPLHWFLRPQADFLLIGESLAVDYLVRLEKIDMDLPPILRRVGIDVDEIPHFNRSETRNLPTAAREYVRALRRYKALPSVTTVQEPKWTPRLAAHHLATYGLDFSLLDYEPRI